MILVDYNQAMIFSVMGKWLKNTTITNDVLKTVFIERIRTIRNKWKSSYGELTIACDGPNYWRKDIFPFYKHGRTAQREKSTLDWSLIHSVLADFRNDLETYYPYTVIHEGGVEADDVIAHLVKTRSNDEKTLIYSGDGDFLQLKKFANVDQFSPIQQKFISVDNAEKFLREKIIHGDSGDGIPNMLSQDNVFLQNETRQVPITKKRLNELMNNPDTIKHRGFVRNQTLIDFDYIPQHILNKIDESLEKQKGKVVSRQKLMEHFFNTGQVKFIQYIQDF